MSVLCASAQEGEEQRQTPIHCCHLLNANGMPLRSISCEGMSVRKSGWMEIVRFRRTREASRRTRNRCQVPPAFVNIGSMKRVFCVVLLFLAATVLPLRAQGPDDQYISIYSLIQQGDSFNNSNQMGEALAKYQEAFTALNRFQKVYPNWNSRIVNFRLSYLRARIAATKASLSNKVSTAEAGAQTNLITQPPGVSESERQLEVLRQRVNQLQSEKTLLEAKLKEAFATRPAAADPQELAKAREEIESLLKENALLKVSLTNKPAVPPSGRDARLLEESRQALAESERKLAAQTERANNLALEKKVLQANLDRLSLQTNAAAELEATKNALEDAKRNLAEQIVAANRLTQEKDELNGRLQKLMASAQAADVLRAENELLKKQVADVRSEAEQTKQQSRKLVQAESQVTQLQSRVSVLQLEKLALQDHLQQASTRQASRAEDLARIRQLENERDELRRRLNALGGARSARAADSHNEDLAQQVATLRARLAVLEAKAVPYTEEELALFKSTEPELAASKPTKNAASAKAPPPGTGSLVIEAQGYFASKQYDKAEAKYLEILRHDENNAYTLANLGAIQLERGQLDEAEKHIKRALAVAPDDGYSLSLLGYLKFRQAKYSEALDALSRAAEADPNNAEIQNYLGVTLSHEGMRQAAETALRKAIQINPEYGSAHNNLAVIYATQKPPLLALARWHYEKALAAGQPANAELEKLLDTKTASESGK